jgi:prophage maintenance system killer protein
MAGLFGRDKSVISRHLQNVFNSKELNRHLVVAKNATTAADGKTYRVDYYNLDAILSVGYRVNSKRGTQFRIWATQVLKEHLVRGFTVNERRLKEQQQRLDDLQQTVGLLGRVIEGRALKTDEAEGLLHVIVDYSHALSLLDQYDHHQLVIRDTTKPPEPVVLTYEQSRQAIDKMGEQMDVKRGLFGIERDNSFKSAVNTVYQTFGGSELYPSVEEKAANLLYFVVKNHGFVDGNKRIGAFLFIWFLDANRLLYTGEGQKRLADNALVALTLMIAESKSKDKDIIIKVIVNLINKNN